MTGPLLSGAGAEALHPPREAFKAPPQPIRAPDSDKVQPTLIVGGANAQRFATLTGLAREVRERVAPNRLELRPCGFAHDAAIGAGVNVYAVGPAGRVWIGTAAGRGVTVAGLGALIAPTAERAAA